MTAEADNHVIGNFWNPVEAPCHLPTPPQAPSEMPDRRRRVLRLRAAVQGTTSPRSPRNRRQRAQRVSNGPNKPRRPPAAPK